MADTPIKYIVKEKSLIGNELFEAGAEVTLPEGTLPAENLEPTCERGQAEYQKYLASNAERVAKMKDQFGESGGLSGDATLLAKLIATAVTQALKDQKEADAAQAAALAEAEALAIAEAKVAKAKKAAPTDLA
jgi:hypothetical protein